MKSLLKKSYNCELKVKQPETKSDVEERVEQPEKNLSQSVYAISASQPEKKVKTKVKK